MGLLLRLSPFAYVRGVRQLPTRIALTAVIKHLQVAQGRDPAGVWHDHREAAGQPSARRIRGEPGARQAPRGQGWFERQMFQEPEHLVNSASPTSAGTKTLCKFELEKQCAADGAANSGKTTAEAP